MNNKVTMFTSNYHEYHKGFYTHNNPTKPLLNIKYTDFREFPDDEEFPYYSAYELLCGSCHFFALSLKKIFNYNAYVIEGIDRRGFHAFCQIYKKGTWYYVDARGITSSFNEFMDVARTFVGDEYIIRPVTANDVDEWEKDDNYKEEAYAFAEAVIKEYKECYTLEQ